MEQKNCPIEMLSVCSTDGRLTPLRFRLEEAGRTVETVRISEIISAKEISSIGIEAILYVCKVRMGDRERLLELKYTVRSHRWTLFRVIC